ncbi:adenosine monophosphate deaminase [Angomonas deanei]|uniref:Adenosine/AMP deaminase, putative n=1 Tax=Angomonas deanei TaxID=59799 RepID=A0A7G2CJX6_9TRYP|nr:adenosine monophosphate deaminase [Angomonas deanei]CAD2220170.1 Adenosine/AMP deaminase, putative [Angomonas deanei]|eukprot:EPY37740.1 adenosine monophosphate deaminase [Angomonas deanei]
MLDRRRLTRVDITDPEFNSAGRQSATLLQLFLSPYTVNKGAYLADAVRVVLEANEELERGPRATETLVEISGLQEEEWERLAEWMYEQDLLETYRTNRWLISISPSPPIVGKGTEGSTTENTFEIGPKFNTSLENHQQQLENIFLPLFQATVAPEDAKNVHVAGLLANVGAFVVQCGDAPGRRPLSAKRRRPVDVPWSEKVPVSYFLYYVWTNLSALNALRKRCGLNTIQLRTKLSSQSSPEALAVSYMLCDHIIDGTALEAHPAMQYLFGLHRIGVCMSPTYSNALGGVPYIENPFAKFFRRGLRVSLATFAPLLTHTSSEPLTEEYGNVARVCRLSGVDLSEIGLNSAWISSFPDELKSEWLGSDVGQQDWRGNNVEFTNVPTARLELRSRVWTAERNVLRRCEGLEPLSGSDSDDELTSAAVGQDGKRKSDSHFKGGDAPYVVTDPHVDFPRLILTGPYDRDMQHGAAAQRLHRVLELRNQYMLHLHRIEDRCPSESAAVYFNSIENQDPVQQMELAFHKDAHRNFEEEEWMFKTVEGVVVPHEVHQIPRLPQNMYHFGDFCSHVEEVRSIAEDAHVRQFANRRLQLLEHRFRLHIAVNAGREAGSTAEKASQNRDFYQATKVDNTVRMETGMTARQLLDFIVSKAANNGDDIVSHRSGREPQTLRQLLHELDISPDTLTVDNLGVQADGTIGMAKRVSTPRDATSSSRYSSKQKIK